MFFSLFYMYEYIYCERYLNNSIQISRSVHPQEEWFCFSSTKLEMVSKVIFGYINCFSSISMTGTVNRYVSNHSSFVSISRSSIVKSYMGESMSKRVLASSHNPHDAWV